LRSLQGNTFKGKHYRELRQHIERMASTSTLPPAEQQAQVIHAIETAIIVSREIGMSPEGIKACLIAPF
ncbi:MAG: hypothetical protein Q4E49_07805, partial [Bacteroidales bacterium]|nr:hypothetical protein [Bacteroidales bacterium]